MHRQGNGYGKARGASQRRLRLSRQATAGSSIVSADRHGLTRIADSSVFAVLPEARRNWAVASIFGEAERLAELHTQLVHRVQPEDNLIYLGNFLGRGAVAATVQELLVFRRTLMARQLTATHGEIVYLRDRKSVV